MQNKVNTQRLTEHAAVYIQLMSMSCVFALFNPAQWNPIYL